MHKSQSKCCISDFDLDIWVCVGLHIIKHAKFTTYVISRNFRIGTLDATGFNIILMP